MIGGTLTRRQPRLGLRRHLFLQHLCEARLANARLAAQQHDLPPALLDLRPALLEDADFLCAAYQWGPSGTAGSFQATTGHTLIQHAIDRQRLGQAFQEGGA